MKRNLYFSSKDLCLVKELPEIIEMGVDSLKIEGRLKRNTIWHRLLILIVMQLMII